MSKLSQRLPFIEFHCAKNFSRQGANELYLIKPCGIKAREKVQETKSPKYSQVHRVVKI